MPPTVHSTPDAALLASLHAATAKHFDNVLTPTLLIDLDAVEHNIAAIARHIGAKARWRPHVKTIKQSALIKTLMRFGIGQFKCATLDELALILETAERVHPEGDVDALLAYTPSKAMLRGVLELLANCEGATVRVLADCPEHLAELDAWLGELGPNQRLSVLLDVDVGMARTGSAAKTWHGAQETIAAVAHTKVVGLHGYEGHVAWTDPTAANTGYDALLGLAKALPAKQAAFIVTSGSHSFAHALAHKGLGAGKWRHQVSPGTLVLSDLRSQAPAAALGLRQAAFVASRVVSHPTAGRVTFDAGSKAIAPDCPAPSCRVVGWPNLEALSPSEEHMPMGVAAGDRPARGSLAFLVPDHVCTTVNLYRQVVYVRGATWAGTGEVEAMSRRLRSHDNRR